MSRIEQLKQNVANLKLRLADATLTHETISQINQTIRETQEEILLEEQAGLQRKATIPGSADFASEIHAGWDGAGCRADKDKGGSS